MTIFRVVSIDLELSLNFISSMVFPVFVLTPNRSSGRLTTNRSSGRLMCYHSSSGVSFPKSGSIFRNAVTRNVMVQQSITMVGADVNMRSNQFLPFGKVRMGCPLGRLGWVVFVKSICRHSLSSNHTKHFSGKKSIIVSFRSSRPHLTI